MIDQGLLVWDSSLCGRAFFNISEYSLQLFIKASVSPAAVFTFYFS